MKRYLSDVQKQIERLPRRWRGSLLAAVLACLVIFALEVLVESVLESEEEPGRSPLARSIFELSGVYQRAVTVGWRKPEPRFTVIVELNVCPAAIPGRPDQDADRGRSGRHRRGT